MDRSKKTYSAEEALDEVFKLLENNTADTLHDDNGDLEELGEEIDFENEAMERVDMDVDLVETESGRNIPMQLVRNIYHEKPLTKSRIVNSIDTAEDECN